MQALYIAFECMLAKHAHACTLLVLCLQSTRSSMRKLAIRNRNNLFEILEQYNSAVSIPHITERLYAWLSIQIYTYNIVLSLRI